jgi:hypothetical protein
MYKNLIEQLCIACSTEHIDIEKTFVISFKHINFIMKTDV